MNGTGRPSVLLRAKSEGRNGRRHPLLCHMVDTASVVEAMWRSTLGGTFRARLARELGADGDRALRLVAFLGGLHDIGKACPAFQAKCPKMKARLEEAGLCFRRGVSQGPIGHGAVTAAVLPELLGGGPGGAAKGLARAIGGHHGRFVKSADLGPARRAAGGVSWREARRELFGTYACLYGLGDFQLPARPLPNSVLVVLAGLVSVADWIASSEEHFEHVGSVGSPGDYREDSRRRARDALGALCWTARPATHEPLAFARMFPDIEEARPVQERAVQLADELDGPALVVIEAPMGEGKTEAAMFLADRRVASSGGGYYFALPTQATSDQMFGRVKGFLSKRYPRDTIGLALLHGHATLSAEFQALLDGGRCPLRPSGVAHDEGGDEADVIAGEWFTYRKRGLLAPFGVGTIDQALLSVLQTRHFFVRLFGLSQKTVIIDEVHAYDAYMTALMERLLEWLAAIECTVILLSATLPEARRRALLAAYARGAGMGGPAVEEAEYPRLSWVGRSASGVAHVAASDASSRELRLEWIDGSLPAGAAADSFGLGRTLKGLLADGGCAAVVCNTVGRAQDVYRALKPCFPGTASDSGPELDLLHARFLHKDRMERQERALVRFGKPGGKVKCSDGSEREVKRPRRAVLVSTQIIEQSLDLDFDVMVTDLAPADLLLQRSGRMHRHERKRPAALGEPRLFVCQPESVSPEGVPCFGRANEYVYDAHVLLRTWLALRDRERVKIPDEMEELIEEVYCEKSQPPGDASEALRTLWLDTLEEHRAAMEEEESEAGKQWIKHPGFSGPLYRLARDVREEDAPSLHREFQAFTRLTGLSIGVVVPPVDMPVGASANGRPGLPEVRELLRHSVRVSNPSLVRVLLEEGERPASWKRASLLRNHVLVRPGVDGLALDGRIRFDPELGLVYEQSGRRE